MDKICRGSAIGEAHCQGSWADISAKVETARHARGTHIGGDAFKLENTSPQGNHHRTRKPSDTFRTQDWFKHDTCANENRLAQPPPQLTYGYGMGTNSFGNSPRGMTCRSKSQKSFNDEEASPWATPRGPGGLGLGVQRAKSVGLLGMQYEQDDVEVVLFDGARSPGRGSPGNRSPRSPRPGSPAHAAGMPVERGRALELGEDDKPVKARSRSPNFQNSENWMAYSSEHKETCPVAKASTAGLMPSSNFGSKMRRQHSGKVSEMSEHYWASHHLSPRVRGDLAGEPPPPPASSIANCVNHIQSKGKKTNLPKNHLHDEAKRRVQMDANQAEWRRSERKHNFPDAPQSMRQLEEFKSSPRLRSPRSPRAGDGSVDDTRNKQCIVDVQHRTSAEMASSMYPERVESASIEQRKYMVGQEIISWANTGRRGAPECFQNTQRVAATISRDAGGMQAVPTHSLHSVRDHRNSDLLRDHLTQGAVNWQERLTVAPHMMPPPRGPARNPAPMVPMAGMTSDKPSIMSYGDVSCLPSTMPKDTAYLTSGLKVYKYGARTPGYFSPQMPHSQILY